MQKKYAELPSKLRVKTIGLDKQIFERKIVNIFLPISFNICFGGSKEPSHSDSSFEYPQHIFWFRNKKIIFWYALLTKVLVKTHTLDIIAVLDFSLAAVTH